MTAAYDRILAALSDTGMRTMSSRNSARAQCPTHHSTSLSLAIYNHADRAHVHCFAGCDDEAVLADLGMEVRDLFDGEPPPGYVPPIRRERTPWELAMTDIGILHPPPIEHVWDRFVHDMESGFCERREADIAEARKPRDGDYQPGDVTTW